jgi:hypothetical protein
MQAPLFPRCAVLPLPRMADVCPQGPWLALAPATWNPRVRLPSLEWPPKVRQE